MPDFCEGQVVSKDSAIIGDAREYRGSIHANHVGIAKFSTRNDNGYQKVVYAIEMVLEKVQEDKSVPAVSPPAGNRGTTDATSNGQKEHSPFQGGKPFANPSFQLFGPNTNASIGTVNQVAGDQSIVNNKVGGNQTNTTNHNPKYTSYGNITGGAGGGGGTGGGAGGDGGSIRIGG